MAINISKTKLMYVTSKPRHSLPSEHFLDNVIDESSSERLLGVNINNDLIWNTHIENVIKKCNTFNQYCLELKSFSPFKTENGFIMLTYIPILIVVVLFGVIVLIHGRQRAARAILDVDFTVPSETMVTQLKWMTFAELFTIKQSKCTKPFVVMHLTI